MLTCRIGTVAGPVPPKISRNCFQGRKAGHRGLQRACTRSAFAHLSAPDLARAGLQREPPDPPPELLTEAAKALPRAATSGART